MKFYVFFQHFFVNEIVLTVFSIIIFIVFVSTRKEKNKIENGINYYFY